MIFPERVSEDSSFSLLIRCQDHTWRYFEIDMLCDVTLAVVNKFDSKKVIMVFVIGAVRSVESPEDFNFIADSFTT
jgi:hypothetical protein